MKSLIYGLLLTTPLLCLAQSPIKNATANDLVEKLAPSEDQPKTRSLGNRNIIPQPKSIDLVIQFELDSAKLKADAKPLLNSLVDAMKNDRLASVRFKVEGHTDALGTEQHNLKLSQNRADKVIAYLTSQGVDKDRLAGEGKGYSELLLPEKPKAAENRRVRITTQP